MNKDQVYQSLRERFNLPDDAVLSWQREKTFRTNDLQIAWNKYLSLAEVYFNLQDYNGFYEAIDKAIELFFSHRITAHVMIDNLDFLRSKSRLYYKAIVASLEIGKYVEAIQYMQLYKAEGFYLLSHLPQVIGEDERENCRIQKEKYKRWVYREGDEYFIDQYLKVIDNIKSHATRDRIINSLHKQIQEMTISILDDYYDHFANIKQKQGLSFAGFKQFYGDISIKQIQDSLAADEALIDYWVFSVSRIVAIVITADSIHVKDIDIGNYKMAEEIIYNPINSRPLLRGYDFKATEKLKTDLDHVKEWHTNRKAPQQESRIETLKSLYSTLIEPIAEYLTNIRAIYIVPHDFLHIVPFHALSDSAGKILVETFQITYSPFINNKRFVKAKEGMWQELHSIGNPDNGDMSRTLSFAEWESVSIAKLANIPVKKYYTGTNATTSAFTYIRENSIIHYSGHGAGNREAAIFSYLRLNDDIVLGEDILFNSKYSFNNCLIFLNGCQTGTKDWRAFDENLSLVSLFFAKGASFVISASWEIDDICAFLFAKSFLLSVINDQTEPSAAYSLGINKIRNTTVKDVIAICEEILYSGYFSEDSFEVSNIESSLKRICYSVEEVAVGKIIDNRKSFLSLLIKKQSIASFFKNPETLEKKCFDHPYYWAAFQLCGW